MKYACLVDAPWNARLALKTAPTAEPVSLVEFMAHSRIDNPAENTYLTTLITAARQWVESYLGRQLMTATWTLTLDCFPADGVIELPRPPLVSVSSVKYYDSDRVLQTFGASSYYTHLAPDAGLGMVELADGESWPTVFSGEGAVQVEYVAGYASAGLVPAQIRQAVMMHAAEMYERREQVVVGTISQPVAITVERLLWPLRVW